MYKMNTTAFVISGFIDSFLMQSISNYEVINIDKYTSPIFKIKYEIIDI